MKKLADILKQYYGIDALGLKPVQGGWAALAYEVRANEGTYFLKVYEKQRASTAKLTSLIDQYAPILVWLEQETELAGKIPVPLLTKDGDYQCEDEDYICLLFPFIDGETIGEKELSNQQINELSDMIATLHLYGQEIPVSTKHLIEDFSHPFSRDLEHILNKDVQQLPSDLGSFLFTYKDDITQRIHDLKELSMTLRNRQIPMALCHFDVHNWNLIQADKLMLIDWEGLKIAPVESDIMFLLDQPYYHEFISTYKKLHPDYVMNQEALTFYQIKRNLEDSWEFIEQILYEDIDLKTKEEAFYYLDKLMKALKK